jgi:hypothetical protein
VRLDALAVEEDVGRQQLAPDEIVYDQGRDVALPAAGVLRRPVVLLVGGVEAPRCADRLFELRERE